jgi:hypothetical protein
MMIGFRREFNELVIANNGYVSQSDIDKLKNSWKFKCIRNKMTCIFGDGVLFDSLYSVVQVAIDGLDYMILEGDDNECTSDFIIA